MDLLFAFLFIAVLLFVLIRTTPNVLSTMGYRGWYSSQHECPVCGAKVKADRGYGMMYEGSLYRFCSKHCLDLFDADQLGYLKNDKNSTGSE